MSGPEVSVMVHDASGGPLALPADVVAVPAVVRDAGPVLAPGADALADGLVALPSELSELWRARAKFEGRPGQQAVLRSGNGGEGPDLAVLGMGPEGTADAERFRRAGAAAVQAAGRSGHVAVVLPASLTEAVGVRVATSALVEGAVLAAYRFDDFRGQQEARAEIALSVVVDAAEVSDAQAGVERGRIVAEATSRARDLVNTPPSDLTPTVMAATVGGFLDGLPGVSFEAWELERITTEHLGGLLGVSRGSAEPPRFLWAEYMPPDLGEAANDLRHVVLVGKGITFDSGGLSLKTADGMTTMKTDMSGAAAVMSTLAACPALGVRARVTALAPLAENMPGGGAIKPGDVLTIRNGATIEVLNTDAEGRLVLADALSLAAELEPDAIIDLATLTGAAVVALGRSIAAIFGTDEELVESLRRAGDVAGEPSWPLPLPDDYADHIDSDIADMKNVGRPGQAGSIAAAHLLRRFVGDSSWAHLDIAGPARAVEAGGYLTKGGTGFGVRTLLELLSA